MEIFTGSAVALITPFKEDGQVDWPAFDDLINFHIDNQTDALVITGTTGEVSTLTDQEQIALIARAVTLVEGRVPVIAGTGINDTLHSIYLSQEAEKVGADALLLVTPYYNKGNYQGLLRHFTAIADAVNIPVILYDVPGRTGVGLTVDQVVTLSQHPNIQAIKDARGDMDHTRALATALDLEKFAIYSGNDDLIFDVLEAGGKGVISVLANVAPKETHDLCQAYLSGNTSQAKDLQDQLASLIDALFVEVNPIPVKYLSHLLGWNENAYRLPLWEPSDQVKELLRQHLPALNHYQKEQ